MEDNLLYEYKCAKITFWLYPFGSCPAMKNWKSLNVTAYTHSTHDSGACLYPPVLSNIKAERKKKNFIMKTHPYWTRSLKFFLQVLISKILQVHYLARIFRVFCTMTLLIPIRILEYFSPFYRKKSWQIFRMFIFFLRLSIFSKFQNTSNLST